MLLPPVARLLKRPGVRLAILLVTGAFVLYALPIPSSFSQYIVPQHKNALVFDHNGLAHSWMPDGKVHPIEQLMARGKARWEELLSRQSKTLKQATIEYKRRYRRNPPRGFDAWWKWAMDNNVKIVDDYDQIDMDARPFWGISPETFRARAKAVEADAQAFVTHLDPNGPSWVDGGNPSFRSKDMLNLMLPLAPHLPEATVFTTSTHDLGSWILGDDQRLFLEAKVANGKYATEEELKPFENKDRHKAKGVGGLASACPVDSLAWLESVAVHEAGGKPPTPRPVYTPIDAENPNFIHDHRATYDFCYHTDLLKFHGSLSTDVPKIPMIRPMFQQSKYARNGEFVITPLDYFFNLTDEGKGQYMPWDKKEISKVFWRGKTTGDAYSHRNDFNWRNSHRIRLHTLTHATEGHRNIYVKSRRTGGWEMQTWQAGKLNEAYTDIGLTDGPMQCDKKDGTCEEMQEAIDWSPRVMPPVAAKYKYVIDVDGNGWSSRFHRLLSSGSVAIKSTIYPEHFTDWLIPWYHYVPVQPTYSELYLILSFFIGVPGSPSTGNDDLARQIAENGRKFSEEHWRWEDMQSYMFRLVLEYIRLGKDDRDAWDFTV